MWEKIENYGIPDQKIEVYSLTNQNGSKLTATNLGCAILGLQVKGRDVVLGYDNLTDYLINPDYMGVIIGRVANRIAGSSFHFNGRLFQLTDNEAGNHLHGGALGLHRRVFQSEIRHKEIQFAYFSPEGEEGYPGGLRIKITYTLTDHDELVIQYFAESDRPAPFAPTSHCYYNLNGHDAGKINHHQLQISAKKYTPLDSKLITTGEIRSIDGSEFDFSNLNDIGSVKFDVNYVLDKKESPQARLISDDRNLSLDISSTFPCLYIYSSDKLNARGKNGCQYGSRSGICLETQYYPNALNIKDFEIPIVSPDKHFYAKTVYAFS